MPECNLLLLCCGLPELCPSCPRIHVLGLTLQNNPRPPVNPVLEWVAIKVHDPVPLPASFFTHLGCLALERLRLGTGSCDRKGLRVLISMIVQRWPLLLLGTEKKFDKPKHEAIWRYGGRLVGEGVRDRSRMSGCRAPASRSACLTLACAATEKQLIYIHQSKI